MSDRAHSHSPAIIVAKRVSIVARLCIGQRIYCGINRTDVCQGNLLLKCRHDAVLSVRVNGAPLRKRMIAVLLDHVPLGFGLRQRIGDFQAQIGVGVAINDDAAG